MKDAMSMVEKLREVREDAIRARRSIAGASPTIDPAHLR